MHRPCNPFSIPHFHPFGFRHSRYDSAAQRLANSIGMLWWSNIQGFGWTPNHLTQSQANGQPESSHLLAGHGCSSGVALRLVSRLFLLSPIGLRFVAPFHGQRFRVLRLWVVEEGSLSVLAFSNRREEPKGAKGMIFGKARVVLRRLVALQASPTTARTLLTSFAFYVTKCALPD